MSDFGWAYVSGTMANGPVGSLQFQSGDGFISGSSNLVFASSTNTLTLAGTLNVDGVITASNYVVNNISHMYSQGSSQFGNSNDDTHEFTGSLNLIGNLSASQNISASHFYGNGSNLTGLPVQNYNSAGDNRILTSADSNTIQGESNLTFDGTDLTIATGDAKLTAGDLYTDQIRRSSANSTTTKINLGANLLKLYAGHSSHEVINVQTGSVKVVGDLTASGGNITQITASQVTANQVSATTLVGTLSTAAQTNVTSLGTLTHLTVSGDLSVDGASFKVHAASDKVSIGVPENSIPAKKFEIYSNTGDQFRLSNSDSSWPNDKIQVDFSLDDGGDLTIDPTRDVIISGSMVVSGTVYAKQLITDIVQKNVSHISATGSTKFGDTSDDTHIFTGSMYVSSALSSSTFQAGNIQSLTLTASSLQSTSLTASNAYVTSKIGIGTQTPDAILDLKGDGSAGNEVLRFSLDGDRDWSFAQESSGAGTGLRLRSLAAKDFHIDATAIIYRNYNGSGEIMRIEPANSKVGIGTATPTHKLTVDGAISGSTVYANDGTFGIINGTLSNATQNAITSVGTLDDLTVSGDLSVDGNTFKIDSGSNKVGIGKPTAASKLLEIYHDDNTGGQFRLSNITTGLSPAIVYTDFRVDRSGDLYISPSGADTFISGNLEVSGAVYAREFITDIVNKNVTIIDVTGSTNFGDTADDRHVFTGSMHVSSSITAPSFNATTLSASTHVSASTYYGDGSNLTGLNVAVKTYNNSANHRVVTSTGGTGIEGEANLTFDGNTLNITGQVTASNYVSASNFYGNSATFNTIGGTLSTATQNAITSVGTLSNLTVSGDLNIDSDSLYVKSSTNGVGIGLPNAQVGARSRLEIYNAHDEGRQLRLSNLNGSFPANTASVDMSLLRDGSFVINPSGTKTVITGNLEVSGTVFANEFRTNVVSTTVTNISATGSTQFGDSSDDAHTFTGGMVMNGGITNKRVLKTNNYTITNNDYFIGVSASTALTLSLPAANTCNNGQNFVIKDEAGNSNTYNIQISCSIGNSIDGENTLTLTIPHAAVNIYTDGSSKFFIY